MNRCIQRLLFGVLAFFTVAGAWGQPTLPNITGTNEKGIVVISWICQFDGVKSISVRHSADSFFNYAT
ncbi:MAG: hypothetical protein EBZ77_14805, partial [Chitinophagia bacterium]|nr:hypothetical protein [Chitinophagia bacterium]